MGFSQTFTWTQPAGVKWFDLIVGTGGPGSNNIRRSNVVNTNALTLPNLPTNGATIYVRLWAYDKGWTFKDYTYQASNLFGGF